MSKEEKLSTLAKLRYREKQKKKIEEKQYQKHTGQYTKQIHLFVTEEQAEKIRDYANLLDVSVNELFRDFIDAMYEKHKQRIDRYRMEKGLIQSGVKDDI